MRPLKRYSKLLTPKHHNKNNCLTFGCVHFVYLIIKNCFPKTVILFGNILKFLIFRIVFVRV